MSDRAQVAAATRTINAGSKSFAAAARLFDRTTRESAVTLYAWCRHCDDVVDGQALGYRDRALANAAGTTGVDELERQTRAALSGGEVSEPAFAGLGQVFRRHDIPQHYALQHLDGFRMDVAGRRYATIADTLDYAYHVAGVVGVMMGYVMGARDAATLDRASDLGVAFQLTNIARDIVDDFEAGRLYLPAEWLAQADIPEDDVANPAHRERLAVVAARLLDVAEPYYASAGIGIRSLPPRAAWAIATAHGVYRQIGLVVRARGARAWDRRVSTSSLQKLRHVAAAGLGSLGTGRRPASVSRTGLYSRPG